MPNLSLTSVDTDTTLVADATPDELLPTLLPELGEFISVAYDDIRITTEGDVRVVPAEDPPGGDTTGCSGDALSTENQTALTWSTSLLDADGGTTTAQVYLDPFYIRPASASQRTRLVVSGTPAGLAWDHLHAYAIDCAGTRLLTGTQISDGVFEFSPAVATSVCGFELELDTDVDTDFSFTTGSALFSPPWGMNANTEDNHLPPTGGGGGNLTIGNAYELRIHGHDLDFYYGNGSGSGIGDYIETRTTVMVDIANGTDFSGRIGSEHDYDDILVPHHVYNLYTTLPAGVLRGTLDTGSTNQYPNMTSHMWFVATATKVNVKAYDYPGSNGINWRASIYNATIAMNRSLSLDSGSTVDNTCTYQPGQVDMEVRTVGLLTESVVPAYIVVSPEEL